MLADIGSCLCGIPLEVAVSNRRHRKKLARTGQWREPHNDLDSFEIMVKVAPSVRPGQFTIYHAWENYQFRGQKGFQNLIPTPLNPVELAGGQFHLRPMANRATPIATRTSR